MSDGVLRLSQREGRRMNKSLKGNIIGYIVADEKRSNMPFRIKIIGVINHRQ